MARLRFSACSRSDLEGIWERIAADSVRNADAVHERLYGRCLLLRSHPRCGHRRDEVKLGLRSLSSDGYAIFHRCVGMTVHISRIIHHSRDLTAIDFDEQP